MFVIVTGPLNAHYELTTKQRMGKSFESNEDAREYLLKHFQANFAEHGYDADNDVWWGKKKGEKEATGFVIQNT